MSGIIPIEYDADMDRFYIPVNSQYEIQTKGKGSSFRIANISTHERMLVADTYLHPMLEDMAKGCNAEYSQLHAQNTQLQLDNAKLRDDISSAFIKLKSLPRFSFLSPQEGGVRKFADKSGNWIEHYEAVKILDDLIYEPTLYTSPSNSDRVKELEEENLKLKATIEMYKGAKKCTDCNLEWTDSNLDCPKCGKEVTL